MADCGCTPGFFIVMSLFQELKGGAFTDFSELGNIALLDFSGSGAYHVLKIGGVYPPVDEPLKGGSCYSIFNEIWKARYDEFAYRTGCWNLQADFEYSQTRLCEDAGRCSAARKRNG